MCRYTCTASVFCKHKILANFATLQVPLVKFNHQLSFPQLSYYLSVKLLSHFKILSTINTCYCTFIPTMQQTEIIRRAVKNKIFCSLSKLSNHTTLLFKMSAACPLYFHTSRFFHKTSRIYPDHCPLSCRLP